MVTLFTILPACLNAMQAQLAAADALKAEGNTLFAEGNMEEAIVSPIHVPNIAHPFISSSSLKHSIFNL